MDFERLKKLEDLKEECQELEKESIELYNNIVEPLIQKFKADLMSKMEAYFKKLDFEVQNNGHQLKAIYKGLIFYATADTTFVTIGKADHTLGQVRIVCETPRGFAISTNAVDELQLEIDNSYRRIESVKKNIEIYRDPKIVYKIEPDKRFDTAEEVISKIFN